MLCTVAQDVHCTRYQLSNKGIKIHFVLLSLNLVSDKGLNPSGVRVLFPNFLK